MYNLYTLEMLNRICFTAPLLTERIFFLKFICKLSICIKNENNGTKSSAILIHRTCNQLLSIITSIIIILLRLKYLYI